MTAEPRMARSGETWRNAPAPVCEAEMKRLASRRLIVASVLAASKALMRSSVRIHLSACTTMLSCFCLEGSQAPRAARTRTVMNTGTSTLYVRQRYDSNDTATAGYRVHVHVPVQYRIIQYLVENSYVQLYCTPYRSAYNRF